MSQVNNETFLRQITLHPVCSYNYQTTNLPSYSVTRVKLQVLEKNPRGPPSMKSETSFINTKTLDAAAASQDDGCKTEILL